MTSAGPSGPNTDILRATQLSAVSRIDSTEPGLTPPLGCRASVSALLGMGKISGPAADVVVVVVVVIVVWREGFLGAVAGGSSMVVFWTCGLEEEEEEGGWRSPWAGDELVNGGEKRKMKMQR